MSILIGQHIQARLAASVDVALEVEDRIYPLFIPMGAPEYPFVCYVTDDITDDGTKDGYMDIATVEVAAVAKTYGAAVRLAHDVRYTLDGVVATYENFEVVDAKMVSYAEEYMEEADAVCATLTFELKTIDK